MPERHRSLYRLGASTTKKRFKSKTAARTTHRSSNSFSSILKKLCRINVNNTEYHQVLLCSFTRANFTNPHPFSWPSRLSYIFKPCSISRHNRKIKDSHRRFICTSNTDKLNLSGIASIVFVRSIPLMPHKRLLGHNIHKNQISQYLKYPHTKWLLTRNCRESTGQVIQRTWRQIYRHWSRNFYRCVMFAKFLFNQS